MKSKSKNKLARIITKKLEENKQKEEGEVE